MSLHEFFHNADAGDYIMLILLFMAIASIGAKSS